MADPVCYLKIDDHLKYLAPAGETAYRQCGKYEPGSFAVVRVDTPAPRSQMVGATSEHLSVNEPEYGYGCTCDFPNQCDGRCAKPSSPVESRPEWIWYCESTSGVPVVTFGRWAKYPQQVRYKIAAIQPTEHDRPTPDDWALKRIKALEEALKPLAGLEMPTRPQGNAGAYSIRHKDIEAARAALSAEVEG